MKKNYSKKPIALALGATFALAGMAAQASVFQVADLGAGYMVASAESHKGKEGKCGEGKCGEGKCGSAEKFKAMDKDGDGKLSQDEFMAGHKKGKEAKCGEGKCGGDKKGAEGKCGGKK